MKKITFFILFFSFFTAKAQVNTQDSLALLALYNSTDGANWTTTWNLNNPVGSWHGVTTTNGRVVELNLFFNNLNGSIPTELGNLSALTSLILSLNQLTGSIPSELGNLTALTSLDLNSNQLTGSIPSELGNLSALTSLDLASNQFTGSIPSELGNLTNLQQLYLASNQLTGSIPSELGNLTNLQQLYLASNQLTGSIPSELGNLVNLQNLFLSSNQLRDLPDLSHITGLNGSSDFHVQNNFLVFEDIEPNRANLGPASNYSPQGPVREGQTYPNVFGTDLVLSVAVNGTGNVYQWFLNDLAIAGESNSSLNLTNIQEADFGSYYCQISNPNVPGLTLRSSPDTVGNPFPSDILTSDFLILLNLYNNTNGAGWNTTWDLALSPTSWGGITLENQRVVSIILTNNNLLGTLASDLGLLDSLQTLDLGNNELSGVLPAELGNLAVLTTLDLGNNELSGVLPAELGNLAALTRLELSENQLTGSIPSELGNLTALTSLELNNNQLTGSIPTELGNLTALTDLDLDNNQLTGFILSELGNLTALTSLNLNDNLFTGSIPTELGNLVNLQNLLLDNNQLTDLPDLSHLTDLSGSIDFQVQNNFLDFGDIEPNRANLVSASNYSPQGPVREGQTYPNVLGTDLVLSVAVNGTGNVYQWFFNDVAIGGANASSLNLTNIQEADFGLYYCQISNPNVPGLTLRSLPDIVGNPFPSDIVTSDFFILLNLYNSTNGAGWNTTWDLALSPTSWGGITLENQRVVSIDLANNNLLGTLASDLGLLDSLQTLDLSNNELSGAIPAELGNLTALTTLDLGTNELSGAIPAELGNLAALTTLDLGTNELSGALPNTLANLTNLLNLKLENNAFTGLSDLTALTQLIVFSVQNNQLDFGDLQPNIAVLTVYSPQKPVREGENYTLVSGSNLMLSVDVDGTGNIYQWFYNSNPIANASNSSLDLMDLQTEESGLYYCEISNPNVPSLILTSLPDNLKVLPNAAPTGIALSNNSIEENLAIGTLIGLLSTTDSNPTDEHTYTISDNTNFQISADSLYANISFDYETIESYNLTVTSTDLGGLTYSDDLIISIVDVDDDLVTAIEDVFTQTEIVLYPNPSTNFLHIRGLKKIGVVELLFYNLQGQIVKEYSEIQDVYDVSDLPKGFYIALIKTLNFEKTINFIIN